LILFADEEGDFSVVLNVLPCQNSTVRIGREPGIAPQTPTAMGKRHLLSVKDGHAVSRAKLFDEREPICLFAKVLRYQGVLSRMFWLDVDWLRHAPMMPPA